VHLRRALLLFALVLGLTALVASIAPPPRHEAAAPAPTPDTESASPPVTLAWTFPPAGHKPAVRRVTTGAHLVVAVSARAAGQASIPKLGRTIAMTETTPARFDLVAPPAGRYDVLFQPALGEAARVGTIVTRP
jgi:hypothetical protein